jgi:hypothetical protein
VSKSYHLIDVRARGTGSVDLAVDLEALNGGTSSVQLSRAYRYAAFLCGGCQARMGVVVAPALRRDAGHSRLTAGHRCPSCTTVARSIRLASIPGEEGSSPGTPSSSGDGRIVTRSTRAGGSSRIVWRGSWHNRQRSRAIGPASADRTRACAHLSALRQAAFADRRRYRMMPPSVQVGRFGDIQERSTPTSPL